MYLKDIDTPLHDRVRPERTFRPLPKREALPIRIGRIKRGSPRIPPALIARSPQPGGIGRNIGGIGLILGIAEALDSIVHYKDPHPYRLNGPWYLHENCGRLPGAPPYVPNNLGARLDFWVGKIHNCSTGQVPGSDAFIAPAPYTKINISPASGSRTCFISDARSTPAVRYRHDESWWRDATGVVPITVSNRPTMPATGMPWIGQGVDPNVMRQLPGAPPAWPEAPVLSPVPVQWQWSSTPPGEAPPRPHVRQPPGRGDKENKQLSKAAKVGIFLWHLLDVVSETSEIINAIYQSLPAELIEKWGCAKGTNIGQYGSDTNTCQLRALYENWHLINADVAIRNIAKNLVEDMTIGAFHKLISKLSPPGFSLQKTAITSALAKAQPEVYMARTLRRLFDALGL